MKKGAILTETAIDSKPIILYKPLNLKHYFYLEKLDAPDQTAYVAAQYSAIRPENFRLSGTAARGSLLSCLMQTTMAQSA
ncbi:MAG: hypothetical protein WD185_01525 [Sneathiella sp.]